MKYLLTLVFSMALAAPCLAQKLPVRALKNGQRLLAPRTLEETTHLGAGATLTQNALRTSQLEKQVLQQQATSQTIPLTLNQEAAATAATATPAAHNRSWLVQTYRDTKAWYLKHQRQGRDARLREEARQEAELVAQEAALPQPNPVHTFFATDLTAYIPTLEAAVPDVPFVARPGVLYRGMALTADGQSLINILQNGLRTADVGPHALTRGLAMSGGSRGAVMMSARTPVINLTSFPEQAAYWADLRVTSEGKAIPVIVRVVGQTQSGEVVTTAVDIPASDISHVVALLNYNGQATWCHITLTPEATLAITPYQAAL